MGAITLLCHTWMDNKVTGPASPRSIPCPLSLPGHPPTLQLPFAGGPRRTDTPDQGNLRG